MAKCVCIRHSKIKPTCAHTHTLTSMSLQLLPGREDAGMMGLLAGGAVGLVQCMLGETGSTLTMAGAEPKHTDGDRTTTAEHAEISKNTPTISNE